MKLLSNTRFILSRSVSGRRHYWRSPLRYREDAWAKPKAEFETDEKLYGEIGRLKMELDWLKKKSGINLP